MQFWPYVSCDSRKWWCTQEASSQIFQGPRQLFSSQTTCKVGILISTRCCCFSLTVAFRIKAYIAYNREALLPLSIDLVRNMNYNFQGAFQISTRNINHGAPDFVAYCCVAHPTVQTRSHQIIIQTLRQPSQASLSTFSLMWRVKNKNDFDALCRV